MKDYYRAWDNFDIDKALDDADEGTPKPAKPAEPSSTPNPTNRSPLDPPAPMAPVRHKVVIKGGRGQSSELQRFKDEGNLFF